MNFTKAEQLIILSSIVNGMGIEAAIEMLGEDTIIKIEAISQKVMGSLTLNEIQKLGPATINKLVANILQEESMDEGLPTRLEGSD